MPSSTSWSKSSYSKGGMDNCVECRASEDVVHLRDTQHREHGYLSFPVAEWSVFLAEVRRGGV